MFAFARAVSRAHRPRVVTPVLAISIAALLTACGSTKSAPGPTAGPQVFSWLTTRPEPAPAAVAAASVEIEDDGLPAQSPPPARIRMAPDDPNQPWSPNYGRSASATPAVAGRRADDAWTGEVHSDAGVPDAAATAAAEDDGLPVPLPPEAAGIAAPAAPRRPRGGYVSWQGAGCAPEPGGWRCAR
jgi:hypothetical protein